MANFQKLLSRKHTTLIDSILINAWKDEKRFERLTSIPEYVKNLEIIDGDFYFDVIWMESITSKYANERPEFFLNFVNKGYDHGEELVLYARNLTSSNSNHEVFKKSIELLKNLLVFLPETHPLAKVIEKNLVLILKNKGISEENIHETLLNLSKPTKLNGPALEAKEFRMIQEESWKNEDEKERLLSVHANKFAYLGYREPFSKGYDLSFFKNRLNETIPDEKPEAIEVEFTTDEQKYVQLMQEYVYFRNYRTEKFYEALYYLESIWRKYSVNLGLGEYDLFYYLENEVESLIDFGTKVDDAVIAERKNGYALLLHDNKVSIITGVDLTEYRKVREGLVQETNQIKGTIACKGSVRGKAKIVLKASEQSKIDTGDILVTSMTTPDFVPCMQRAAAFITDEGGITCHAAIVAREMKKPCIIGTKNATKIIKEGDMVEVDANKGIIRIIK